MKQVKTQPNHTSYLDVSEYMLKEHSPLIKPSSPKLHHLGQVIQVQKTPEIAPIDHYLNEFMMSPIQQTLLSHNLHENLEDFILDSQNNYFNVNDHQIKKKKHKRPQRYAYDLHLFRLDSQLQKIIQHDEEDSQQYEFNLQQSSQSEEIQRQEEEVRTTNSFIFQNWNSRMKSKVLSQRDTEQQKRSSFDISIVDYSQTIDRYSKNPKNEIIKRLKQIEFNQLQADQQEKRIMVKKHLQKYLLQYEIFCYEESWKQLNLSLSSAIAAIIRGLQRTFSKKIGHLSFEYRRVKILKYLQKKKKRIWRKKISYDCRKKVADGRLRIKGKFVTREQACQQLGMASLDCYSAQEIKEMLQRKIDESLIQQQLVC